MLPTLSPLLFFFRLIQVDWIAFPTLIRNYHHNRIDIEFEWVVVNMWNLFREYTHQTEKDLKLDHNKFIAHLGLFVLSIFRFCLSYSVKIEYRVAAVNT